MKSLLQDEYIPGQISFSVTPAASNLFNTKHSAPRADFTDPEDKIGTVKKRMVPTSQTLSSPSPPQSLPPCMQESVDPKVKLQQQPISRVPEPKRNEMRYKVIKPKMQQPSVYMKPPPPPKVVILPFNAVSNVASCTSATAKTTTATLGPASPTKAAATITTTTVNTSSPALRGVEREEEARNAKKKKEQ